MRKFIFLPFMALSMMLLSVSCSSDNDDDDESSILNVKDWESADYKLCKYNDVSYIEVPAEGGSFTFRYKNGGNISLDSINMDNGIKNDLKAPHYTYENNAIFYCKKKACQVSINGDEVNVLFDSNNEFNRNAVISVMAGGEKLELRFWQKPIGHSDDVSKKLEGEWVINTDKSELMAGYWAAQKRLCLNSDGTSNVIMENYMYDYGKPRFHETEVVWKDSCGYLVYCYSDHSGYGIRGFAFVDDNSFKMNEGFSSSLYERVEITNEPVKPCYDLNISIYTGRDKITLESKCYAKGKNCKIDKAYLVCYDGLYEVAPDGGMGNCISMTRDTIDVSQYASSNYEFSISRESPKANHMVSYGLVIECSYTTKTFWERSDNPCRYDLNKFTDEVRSASLFARNGRVDLLTW